MSVSPASFSFSYFLSRIVVVCFEQLSSYLTCIVLSPVSCITLLYMCDYLLAL